MSGLDAARYHIVPIGIAKDGTWLIGSNALTRLVAQADPHKLPTGVDWQTARSEEGTDGHMVLPATQQHSWHPGAVFRALHIDVIFPVLHGPMGEDGTVQGLCELAGLPYVGCGVAASAVSLDKALMKAAFAAAGLPLLSWLLVRRHDWQRAPERAYERIEQQLTYPVFVKPANMGSSVGVNKATNRAELEGALVEAASYDRRIVIEQGINAREIEVSVLGNDEPSASTPGEIIPAGEWYDYRAKYIGGQSQIVIPASLEQALKEQVRALAVQAFEAIDGAGLARVDFLLDRQSGALWLNEVNTMPGFTSVSMYAKMWEASGIAYPALLDRLIALALERPRATR
jgi:D-alanine-D-alanine ligase